MDRALAALPPAAARCGKRLLARPRFQLQSSQARRGYEVHGRRYRHNVIYIAGLPKSGSTWLQRMVSSFPGFAPVMLPEAVAYEQTQGQSHRFDLPAGVFSRFQDMLVVMRLHAHGSPHNVGVLGEAGVRSVILHRDLRDVAVSYCFYVRRTPWHPEHALYRHLGPREALAVFALRTLGEYAEWIDGWRSRRDPATSLEISYEDLLHDAAGALRRVAALYELDDQQQTIASIVHRHRFDRLAAGRPPGEEDRRSFFRKGVSGDWRNYFTPALSRLYETAGIAAPQRS